MGKSADQIYDELGNDLEYEAQITEKEHGYVFEHLEVGLDEKFELEWIREKSNEPLLTPENQIRLYAQKVKNIV